MINKIGSTMKTKYQAVRGMNDILPSESNNWISFEAIVRDWLTDYGYSNIRTPILENTNLFIRSIGEATDIVEKEMYTFIDSLNGDSLTLRPENTAACLRAVLEHGLLHNATQRLWYTGPMFRHERPQKGRYRQFHQVGAEALGLEGPDIDAEMIAMTADLWKRIGLTKDIELQVNTLGTVEERKKHREVLIAYLEKYIDILDEDGKRRLYKNPLRVLDTKTESMQEMCNNAPRLMDYLTKETLEHYNNWLAMLTDLNIPYVENQRLVRGLDYYNLSVFEWVSTESGTPITFCGGGRYNGLIEELGGDPSPCIGFAMGVERVLSMVSQSGKLPLLTSLDVYIVHLGEGASRHALIIAKQLREAGYSVKQDFECTSFKAQMKRADASKATVAVIIGEDEVKNNQVTIKNLTNKEINQTTVNITDMLTVINKQFDK